MEGWQGSVGSGGNCLPFLPSPCRPPPRRLLTRLTLRLLGRSLWQRECECSVGLGGETEEGCWGHERRGTAAVTGEVALARMPPHPFPLSPSVNLLRAYVCEVGGFVLEGSRASGKHEAPALKNLIAMAVSSPSSPSSPLTATSPTALATSMARAPATTSMA